MSRGDPQRLADYLGHILQAIDSIRDYTSGATLDSYLVDRKTQDAVVRNLSIRRSSGKPFSTICHHFANRFRD